MNVAGGMHLLPNAEESGKEGFTVYDTYKLVDEYDKKIVFPQRRQSFVEVQAPVTLKRTRADIMRNARICLAAWQKDEREDKERNRKEEEGEGDAVTEEEGDSIAEGEGDAIAEGEGERQGAEVLLNMMQDGML